MVTSLHENQGPSIHRPGPWAARRAARRHAGSRGSPKPDSKEWNAGGILPDFIILPDGVTRRGPGACTKEKRRESGNLGFL